MDTYVASTLENLELEKEKFIEKMGIETYQETIIKNNNTSLSDVVLDSFQKKTIIGMALTIVIAIIMKRKPKPESND